MHYLWSNLRHFSLASFVGLLLTVPPAIFFSSKLSIQADFKNLLPQQKQSVVTLDRIIEKVGGIGTLIVAIESPDYQATKQFIEDLVVGLRQLPEQYVRYIEYNINDTKQFFEDNKYLYIDLEDLVEIHSRLDRKIKSEKLKNNPFYISLEDEDKVEFDVSDIEQKYEGKASSYDQYTDGYYFGENNQLAAVLIKPYGVSTGVAFSKQLIAQVQSVIDGLDPTTYHVDMHVEMVGKFQETVREYYQLIEDVLETLGLCLLLVGCSIYLYFFRIRAVLLLTLPLLIGVIWTFGLTWWAIGYLNSQTAFLGSIIVGNGVNSGIILLSRYLEERRNGLAVDHAIWLALRRVWKPTFYAAITTSCAFAALGLSQIKGFSHFGFIGGVGMTLVWLSTMLTLPSSIWLAEKIWPMSAHSNTRKKHPWHWFLKPCANFVAGRARSILWGATMLAVASVVLAVQFFPDGLEYNFAKLRNRPDVQQYGEVSMGDRVTDVFKKHTAPSVMLVDTLAQAKNVCEVVLSIESDLSEDEKTIEQCQTIYDFIPDQQPEKLAVVSKIRRLLNDSSLNFVDPKYRQDIEDFKSAVNLQPIDIIDLPQSIRRNFTELDNTLGRIVYIYPRKDAQLSNGRRLIRFARSLETIELSDGSTVHMSGQAAIFADLLQAVRQDGPKIALLSLFAVTLLIGVNLRRFFPMVYVMGGLLLGVVYFVFFQALFQIKLNFFNFIAIPVTFGIGVDYGVNLFGRFQSDGRRAMRRVLVESGGAILLCSLTTIIGYTTLITARNQALGSFGWLALMGEFACLLASLVVMPALLMRWRKFPVGKSHAQ